jgi:hypothetical protein
LSFHVIILPSLIETARFSASSAPSLAMANLAFVLVVVLERMAMFGGELVMGLVWCGVGICGA